MLKRALFVFVALVLATAAHAAGTISLSMTQQLDELGKPLVNCYLYTIQAGTVSTPQNSYQDSALTILWPNPLRCDAAGRLPQFFLADGSIKIRLTDQNGTQKLVADGLLVVGPSGGGGGGSTVDATTIFATGDVKQAYGNSILTGWVRLNGRTIGSATSGATERANADTQALFTYLWGADANLAVSGGRGASAAADWAANKTITLPDARNRILASLGDMGNTDANLFSGATFTYGTGTTLGATIGASRRTLATANLPPYTPSGSISLGGSQALSVLQFLPGTGTGGTNTAVNATTLYVYGSSFTASFSGTAQGGTSTAFDIVQPTILVTTYIKL